VRNARRADDRCRNRTNAELELREEERRANDLSLVLVVRAGEDGVAVTNGEAQVLAALAQDSQWPRVLHVLVPHLRT
jgi:hypothetical protein